MPGNQQAVDLVGAFEDAVDARVAVVALGRVVAHEAVAAVDLDVLVEHEVQHLAAGDLRDRRFDGVFLERGERRRSVGRARAAWPSMRASISPAVR